MSALGSIDRVLGVVGWLAAAALVVMLFVGPVLVAEDEPASGSPPAADGDGGSGGSDQDGAELFAENCGSCHTLEAAGTSGVVGPPLDDAGLDSAQVAEIVSNGQGGMPSFSGSLDEEQIQAIADFVADSSS